MEAKLFVGQIIHWADKDIGNVESEDIINGTFHIRWSRYNGAADASPMYGYDNKWLNDAIKHKRCLSWTSKFKKENKIKSWIIK